MCTRCPPNFVPGARCVNVAAADSVFAFQAKGPVKFFTLGDVSEGDKGDWVVAGEDGDVMVVSRAEFANT